jgi:hypothetical protein
MACHKIEADFNCDDCQQNFASLNQFIRDCREIHKDKFMKEESGL